MLEILFEDYHLLVVNKPAPLLTQAPADIPSLEALAKQYIKEKYAKPAGVYLGIPHRLDRPVTGVVLFARNTKAAQRMAVQFQNHTVQKVYWAAVGGDVAFEHAEWVDWLLKLPEQSRTEIVTAETPGAKQAISLVTRLQSIPGGSLLELRPKTGRMHQLRVQSASRGHPVQGDSLYGSTIEFGPPAEHSRDRLVALHARSLTFQHPFRKEEVTVTAPHPPSWVGFGIES